MNDIPESVSDETLGENDPQESVEPSMFKRIFINRFSSIRAGWRIVIYLALTFGISEAFKPLHEFLKTYLPESKNFNSVSTIVGYVFLVSAFLLAAYIILRWIDKRPFGTLGLNFSTGWLKELSIGMSMGFGLMTLMFIIFLVSGLIDVTAGAMDSTVALGVFKYLILFIFAGTFEELLLRGYAFQAFIEGSNIWIPSILLSLVFSILHIFNPNYSAGGAIIIFLAGILFSIIYIKTRSLWMPVGMHFAWNWTQGSLWGMNVSGIDIKDSILVSTPHGPELLSGGDFGAEGSLITAFFLILLCWYLWKAEWLKPSESNSSILSKYSSGFGVEPVDK